MTFIDHFVLGLSIIVLSAVIIWLYCPKNFQELFTGMTYISKEPIVVLVPNIWIIALYIAFNIIIIGMLP